VADGEFIVFILLTARQIVLPISKIKIQNGSSYDYTDRYRSSRRIVHRSDRVWPDEIQPTEVIIADADTDADRNAPAENRTNIHAVSAETVASAAAKNNIGADAAENIAHAFREIGADPNSAAHSGAENGRADPAGIINDAEDNSDADPIEANFVAEDNVDAASAKSDANANNAVDSVESNAAAENCNGTKPVETGPYARADRSETDSNAGASARRQSLSRSPGRELQRQKIPHDGEWQGSRAYAVPRLGSKEYRRRQYLNLYRYEER